MGYLTIFGIIFIVVAIISWRWVLGIDYMKENHSDYKGDDLFGLFGDNEENENDKHQIM